MSIAVLKNSEIKSVEMLARQKGGISEGHMIAQAGFKVFQWALDFCRENNFGNHKTWVICCGKGHNGADGLQCALYAHEYGIKTQVYHIPSQKGYSPETTALLAQLGASGIKVHSLKNESSLKFPLDSALIIDGLLGSGLSSAPRSPYLKIISKINKSKLPVLSIDLPSGMSSEEKTSWPTIKAQQTFQLGAAKISCLFFPGFENCGVLKFSPLCFEPWYKGVKSPLVGCRLYNNMDLARLYTPPKPEGHKYQKGKLLVIAGSKGMHGAALLAAEAALSAGAGMVRLAVPPAIEPIVNKRIKEVIAVSLKSQNTSARGHFHPEHLTQLDPWIKWCDGIVLGPGIGKEEDTQNFVRAILKQYSKTIVLDGDGIHALKGLPGLKKMAADIIATPHSGEYENIGGTYQWDKPWELIHNALKLSGNLGITLVLKGPTTMYMDPKAGCAILPRGSRGLATAGSGDVLAGTLGALLCQFPKKEAALLAVGLHSQASLLEEKKSSSRGIKASQISHHFGTVYKNWEDLG